MDAYESDSYNSEEDHDYIPEAAEDADSEEEVTKKNSKRKKSLVEEDLPNDDANPEQGSDSKEERISKLWDSFKTDTSLPSLKSTSATSFEKISSPPRCSQVEPLCLGSGKDNKLGSKSLLNSNSLLSTIQNKKKQKMNALQMSQLSWELHKKETNSAEELANFNKNGYLEKVAFLERADLRAFEIEKDFREKERKRRLP